MFCFYFFIFGYLLGYYYDSILSGHVTFDHLHGGIKSGISVLFICLMKSLACSKRNTLCDSFLIIRSFYIFGSFGVADFAFLI